MNPPDDSRLEALLKRGFEEEPLRDGGFSARVAAALPRRRPAGLDVFAAVGWVVAALGIGIAAAAAILIPWRAALGPAMPEFQILLGRLSNPWVLLALGLALLSGGGSWLVLLR